MAAIGNSCFWSADFQKSSLKLLGQMNRNLVGSTYYDCLFLPDSLTSMAAIYLVGSYTSRCGLMTDAALVYSALVYSALVYAPYANPALYQMDVPAVRYI